MNEKSEIIFDERVNEKDKELRKGKPKALSSSAGLPFITLFFSIFLIILIFCSFYPLPALPSRFHVPLSPFYPFPSFLTYFSIVFGEGNKRRIRKKGLEVQTTLNLT